MSRCLCEPGDELWYVPEHRYMCRQDRWGHVIQSPWSEVKCARCHRTWRSKSAYTQSLPKIPRRGWRPKVSEDLARALRGEVNFTCLRCARCCFREPVIVSGQDIARWEREGRDDILDVIEVWDDGGRCPFLRKLPGRLEYKCGIYETRPLTCQYFPRTRRAGADYCEAKLCSPPTPPPTET